jgi:hypothetical protein
MLFAGAASIATGSSCYTTISISYSIVISSSSSALRGKCLVLSICPAPPEVLKVTVAVRNKRFE